jgi:hypothetical protein
MKLSNSTTKTLAFLTFLFLQQILGAQDVQREIGIRSNSFEDFSAVYKWQKAENKYGRLTAAFLGLSVNTGPASSGYSAGMSLTLGNEKRRSLADRTDFLYGLQWVVQASYSDLFEVENEANFQTTAGIAYLLGVHFQASQRFNVGLEFLPSLLTTYSYASDRIFIKGDASFSNAALFATYRFNSPGKQPRK